MLTLVVFHAIILMAAVTSAMGALFILRGFKIFDLKIRTRNFMYIGACCAMCFGFIGATVCVNSSVANQLHYLAAILLCISGVFATAHISVDLCDRLRVLKRDETSQTFN